TLDKRSYKMIWLFLLGYAVIALGSMNRIVEAVPIGQVWEELFLEMEALYTDAGWVGGLVMIIEVCIIAPIVEEILHRGVVINGLAQRFQARGTILLSALIFALMHGNAAQFIVAFFVGILLGIVYYYTRNLLAVIGMHMMYNSVMTFVPIVPENWIEGWIMFGVCTAIGSGIIWYSLKVIPIAEWKRKYMESIATTEDIQ
ncbi:MAG: lysostaphin resistance A-like protein, partial [Bacilli bacterium]